MRGDSAVMDKFGELYKIANANKEYNTNVISRNSIKIKDVLNNMNEMFELFNRIYYFLSSFVEINDIQKEYIKKKYIKSKKIP